MQIEKLSSTHLVRSLTQADVELIFQLCVRNEIFYHYHPPLVTPESIREDMTDLPPGKAAEDKYYLGFFHNGRLEALMDLVLGYPNEQTAYIGLFMADVSVQGRGVGSQIITGCTRYLDTLGFKRLRLGVDKGNPQSSAFWHKNHFRPTGEKVHKDGHSYILMERFL